MDVSGKYVACFFIVEDTLYGKKKLLVSLWISREIKNQA
jgi:hypothetical protein